MECDTKTVLIPQYDQNNPTHVLVTPNNGKWTDAVFNNPTYKHFYVEYGEYEPKRVNLTQSGTDSDKRTITMYVDNNLNKTADVLFNFNCDGYWVVEKKGIK